MWWLSRRVNWKLAPKKKQSRKKNHKQFYREPQKASSIIPPKAKKKHSKKLYLTLASIICLGVIITSVIGSISLQEPTVSATTMDKYAQALVSDYNQQLSFYLPSQYSYFQSYSNSTYNATTIISSNFGSAILLYPANEWSVTNKMTTQQIGDSLFGSENIPHINFQLNDTLFNFYYCDNLTLDDFGVSFSGNSGIYAIGCNDIAFQNLYAKIEPNSDNLIGHVNINSIPYFILILKGSNKANDWSNNTALTDSRRIFDYDIANALNNSETVREQYAEPELDILLMNALTKWDNQLYTSNGTITYTSTQFEYDLQQIEKLAQTKYGITNNDYYLKNHNIIQ